MNHDYFKQVTKDAGILLTEEQMNRFDTYTKVLLDWNQKMNLTAITAPDEIVVKHFLDSLLILPYLPNSGSFQMIDVGTGAGFPSVPCRIVRPEIRLTLLDSLNKRVNFLKYLSEKIGQENACIHARAEDAGKNVAYREQFDVATARAVAHLRELSEYCLPLVKAGGIFAAMKGPGAGQEIEEAETAIRLLGGKIEQIIEKQLPDGSQRSIILIKKISQTPTKYPRITAKIKKNQIK